jgi:hypothetical protein
MGLDRVVGFRGDPVRHIDRDRCLRQARIGIASLARDIDLVGLEVVVDVGLLGLVGHRDRVRGGLRLLEGVRDHKGHVLAEVAHDIVVERGARLVHIHGREVGRDAKHLAQIPALEDGADPRHLPRARRVDGRDGAARNCCSHRHRIEHPWKAVIGRVLGRAGDLDRPIDTGSRLADLGHRGGGR